MLIKHRLEITAVILHPVRYLIIGMPYQRVPMNTHTIGLCPIYPSIGIGEGVAVFTRMQVAHFQDVSCSNFSEFISNSYLVLRQRESIAIFSIRRYRQTNRKSGLFAHV